MSAGTTLISEFALGQKVWIVTRSAGRAIELPCRFCRGRGRFEVTGAAAETRMVDCPDCRDSRAAGGAAVLAIAHPPGWGVNGPVTVGQIEITIQSADPDPEDFHAPRKPRDERYMIEETGIGSGTVYKVEDVFAGKEAADEDAERRTQAALNGDGWKPSRAELQAAQNFLDHRDVYEHESVHVEAAERIVAAAGGAR